ncbi:MAG TPA: BlaI/MecI/CopY family transcriptional regulator [Candidatus Dojkabacteria bacterium]|jgi:predicted transcriptional regulator
MLGELEQKIMDIIWDKATSVSVRQVADSLQKTRDCAYTTVMTIMKRLFDKGLLKREQKGKQYLYFPTRQREEYAKKKLPDLYEKIMNSYGSFAITQFVDSLDDEDLKLLKDYLDNSNDQ